MQARAIAAIIREEYIEREREREREREGGGRRRRRQRGAGKTGKSRIDRQDRESQVR